MYKRLKKEEQPSQYPCTAADIEQLFSDTDITLWMGIPEPTFHFDSHDPVKPQPNGEVLLSAHVYRYDDQAVSRSIKLYTICHSNYAKDREALFIKQYLPLVKTWFQELEYAFFSTGVDCFYISYDGQDFDTKSYHYD